MNSPEWLRKSMVLRTGSPAEWLHKSIKLRSELPAEWLHKCVGLRTGSPAEWLRKCIKLRTESPAEWLRKCIKLRTESPAEWLHKCVVIGITGHRNLPEEKIPSITQSAKDFFLRTKEMHKSITVLSSLAEGADTICAKQAVDIGLRLVVPLPMDIEEYSKDFSESALTDFYHMISKASEVFTVEAQEPAPDSPSRGFYYRQAGIFVAKHCGILFAVWDGVQKDTPDGAGTWETIKLADMFMKKIVTSGW